MINKIKLRNFYLKIIIKMQVNMNNLIIKTKKKTYLLKILIKKKMNRNRVHIFKKIFIFLKINKKKIIF